MIELLLLVAFLLVGALSVAGAYFTLFCAFFWPFIKFSNGEWIGAILIFIFVFPTVAILDMFGFYLCSIIIDHMQAMSDAR